MSQYPDMTISDILAIKYLYFSDISDDRRYSHPSSSRSRDFDPRSLSPRQNHVSLPMTGRSPTQSHRAGIFFIDVLLMVQALWHMPPREKPRVAKSAKRLGLKADQQAWCAGNEAQ